MLPQHLALVSKTPDVPFGELAQVSAALQKQVTRDFTPIWNIEATIDAFPSLQDVPLGYWPIILVKTVQHGGQHKDHDSQPFALIAVGDSWSLAASHEALEMLVDPFGQRLIAGASPMPEQGRVEFLVEICDPCEDGEFAYLVNGFLVSDFCTPQYYDPERVSGVRYSFRGAVSEPHEVLRGGYLTWHEPESGDWFQRTRFTEPAAFKNLGSLPMGAQGIRGEIDRLTPETYRLSRLDPGCSTSKRATSAREAVCKAMSARAKRLEEQIEGLLG